MHSDPIMDPVKPPKLEIAITDFPQFLAALDLESCRDPQMSSNLLTIALLQFLQNNDPLPVQGGFGLSRIKATGDKGVFATMFIRRMGGSDNRCFTALGMPDNAPDEQVFEELLVPGSLGMEDHAQRLRLDPRFPEAEKVIEAAMLRLLAPPSAAVNRRFRL